MENEKTILAQIRTAVADYMQSEGCGCCRDREAHEVHTEKLAKLLKIKATKEGESKWYNFSRYRTNK